MPNSNPHRPNLLLAALCMTWASTCYAAPVGTDSLTPAEIQRQKEMEQALKELPSAKKRISELEGRLTTLDTELKAARESAQRLQNEVDRLRSQANASSTASAALLKAENAHKAAERRANALADEKATAERRAQEAESMAKKEKNRADGLETQINTVLTKFEKSAIQEQITLQEKKTQLNALIVKAKLSAAPAPAIAGCTVCPDMMELPPGTYWRGSTAQEQNDYVAAGGNKDRVTNESPRKQVTIAYRLAVAKYEVSFAEWEQCVNDGQCTSAASQWGKGKQPVINVSWNMIHGKHKDGKAGFLSWLNAKAQLTDPRFQFRLLTEAEWEFAARAGSEGPFSFGAKNDLPLSDETANYDATYTYAGSPKGQYRRQTQAVDSYPQAANAWGLQNMHGNVWEWVQDCYVDNYAQAPTNGDRVGSMDAAQCASDARVLRGGSWFSYPRDLRSAFRLSYSPGSEYDYVGFRLARMLP